MPHVGYIYRGYEYGKKSSRDTLKIKGTRTTPPTQYNHTHKLTTGVDLV